MSRSRRLLRETDAHETIGAMLIPARHSRTPEECGASGGDAGGARIEDAFAPDQRAAAPGGFAQR